MTGREDLFPLRYRKRPVVVEVVQWDGVNCGPLIAFVPSDVLRALRPTTPNRPGYAVLETLEGAMQVTPGDYVIKGVAGEFYPCKPDIFAQTYEAVDDE